MAYDMSTKFTDNRTGEKYEFMGTNITFSERELKGLEREYDEKEDEKLVARLISSGFFDEEWTDYYAETDAEDDDVESGDEDDNHLDVDQIQVDDETTEVERAPLAQERTVDTVDAEATKSTKGTESQFNVPLFHSDSTVGSDAFHFPVAPLTVPKMAGMVTATFCRHNKMGTNIKFAATMSQLRRVFMLNVVN